MAAAAKTLISPSHVSATGMRGRSPSEKTGYWLVLLTFPPRPAWAPARVVTDILGDASKEVSK
jgi:hypothetical protein